MGWPQGCLKERATILYWVVATCLHESVTMQLEKCNLGEDEALRLYLHMLKNNANYSGLLMCLK